MLVYKRLRTRPLLQPDLLYAGDSDLDPHVTVAVYVFDCSLEINFSGAVEQPEFRQRFPPRHRPKD